MISNEIAGEREGLENRTGRAREGAGGRHSVRRCFYFTGNLTLGLAARGEIAMDRASSVLDYDGMIALLIKRGGGGRRRDGMGARARSVFPLKGLTY